MKINCFKKQNHLIYTWWDKVFKGTVVNRTWFSMHWGSLEITRTVPLNKVLLVLQLTHSFQMYKKILYFVIIFQIVIFFFIEIYNKKCRPTLHNSFSSPPPSYIHGKLMVLHSADANLFFPFPNLFSIIYSVLNHI